MTAGVPEGDWIAPWFAAVAITIAWLTLVIVTYLPRHRENRMQSFIARLSPGEGLAEVALTVPAPNLPAAHRSAKAFADDMGGWTVLGVNVTGLLPESSPTTTYVDWQVTA